MTAFEMMTSIRSAGNGMSLMTCFLYLAAHADEARLLNGAQLLDRSDFVTFLHELADAAEPSSAEMPA